MGLPVSAGIVWHVECTHQRTRGVDLCYRPRRNLSGLTVDRRTVRRLGSSFDSVRPSMSTISMVFRSELLVYTLFSPRCPSETYPPRWRKVCTDRSPVSRVPNRFFCPTFWVTTGPSVLDTFPDPPSGSCQGDGVLRRVSLTDLPSSRKANSPSWDDSLYFHSLPLKPWWTVWLPEVVN